MLFQSPCSPVLIPDIDVTSYVLREADRCPTWHDKQRPFCIDADTQETVTIGGFLQDFQALAAGWRQRVQLEPGAVVAVISPNSVHYATVMFSVVRAGGTVLLVNPAYTAQEMATQLADAKVSFAVVDQGALPQVLVACQTAGIPLNHVYTFPGQTDRSSGVANIMTLKMDHPLPFSPPPMQQVHNAATYLFYSSGTTGVPKGVMITHRNIVANLCQFRGFQKQHWSEFSGMVLAGVLPFYHTYGTHILLHQSIIQGATVVVMRKFSLERFLASIEKHQVTCALLVPPILLQMAKSSLLDQYNLKSLKYVVTGAAPAPAGLLQQFLERVPVSMYQGYGLTETSPITLFTPRDVILSGSTGVLLPSMEAQIVDAQGTPLGCDVVGELCIRGPHVMSGYLNNPEATTHCIDKQGFLHTGDLAYVNSQGHFYITGRAKEMIKYQGFQVSPVELEALIITHDRVKDVVVIGVYDDERITEVPRACVVCKDQLGSEVTPRGITEKHQELARDILAFVEKRVAYYKRLRGAFAGLQSVCASIDKCQPGKWALTFDDGPDRRNTLDLLIALKRNNVHATFFIVGCNVEENSDILKGIHADGHEVAVHTWNHPDLTTQTDDEIREQINSTMSVIYKTIGVKPTLMRPPYGYTNERVNRIMVELDLEVILWNVDSKDWKHVDMYGENETAWEATKQTMLTYLHKMNPEKDGGISLQHDKHRASVEKLDEIIDAVRKEGYDLSTVTQCISDRGGYSSPTVIRRVYSAS